mmetsp:Transcript_5934/g.12987  ORF Transcript_5934/g.12987 Transcript_5934/m.12987 type:complete len:213 (-) Transcript_5934:496-1134(-)
MLSELHEGRSGSCLGKAIRDVFSTTCLGRQGILGSSNSLQFAIPAFSGSLVVSSLGSAISLKVGEAILVSCKTLLCHAQVSRRSCLRLAAGSKCCLSSIHLLAIVLHLIPERLPHEPSCVLGLLLLLLRIAQLALCLVQEIFQHLHDVLAVALIDSCVRGTELTVIILRSVRSLHQRGELTCISCTDGRSLDHHTQSIRKTPALVTLKQGRM